jgi:serine/threonine protein kinase
MSSAVQHREALPPGTQVGAYLIKNVLGAGGFGVTYLAEHTALKRLVALKELLPIDCAARDASGIVVPRGGMEDEMAYAQEKFMAEARQLAQFHHPSIVAVTDVFAHLGTAFMVMAYEQGESLDGYIHHARINEPEVRRILIAVLDGLEVVHSAGVIHRDIKPANIYICKDGRPLLLDFGAARQVSTARSRTITSILTPGYAPFEQYHTDGNQGPWTDLYALGGVAHRMITGETPPDAAKREVSVSRSKPDAYEPLTQRQPRGWSMELLQAVDWALALHESDRPQSAAEWRALLKPPTVSLPTIQTIRPPSNNNPPPPPSVRVETLPSRHVMTEYRLIGKGLDIRFDATDFAAEGGELIIGRSENRAHFVIDDGGVSRTHVKLRQQRGHLEIQDLGSGNGTFINGKELQPATWRVLQAGDQLEIGTVPLRCESSEISGPVLDPSAPPIPPADYPMPAPYAGASSSGSSSKIILICVLAVIGLFIFLVMLIVGAKLLNLF